MKTSPTSIRGAVVAAIQISRKSSFSLRRWAPRLVGVAASGLFALYPHTASADGAPRPPAYVTTQPPAPLTNPAATAQGRLDAIQKALGQVQDSLAKATTTNHGGFVEKARDDVKLALADVNDASAYVKAHPEINTLPAGPASATDTRLAAFTIIPTGNRVPGLNLIAAVDSLNAATNQLINNPAPNYHGPVLGDIGGSRAKIIADISKTGSDILAAINSANPTPTGRRGGPVSTQLQPTTVVVEMTETDGPATIQIPRNLLYNTTLNSAVASLNASDGALPDNPLADSSNATDGGLGGVSLVPTAIAGIALSAAIALGGLHFLSRKRLAGAPLAVFLVALVLALIAGVAFADVPAPVHYAPPPPPPPPPSPSPQPAPLSGPNLPQVTGPVVVTVTPNGSTVNIILSRKLINELAAQPPAK
jgi:hypothetical protein